MSNKGLALTVLVVFSGAVAVFCLRGKSDVRANSNQQKLATASADDARASPVAGASIQVTGKGREHPSFASASNLNTYINDLINDPNTPPGAVEDAKARAFSECGVMTRNPNYATQAAMAYGQSSDLVAPYQARMARQMNARCKDFAFSSGLKISDMYRLYGEAAAKGNPGAMAHEAAGAVASMPAAKARDTVIGLVQSGDPQAIMELSNLFGQNGPFEETDNMEVGAPFSNLAWKLVACDQGLDCGADSEVVEMYCLSGGICGPGDLRANIQYSAVSPAQF